MIPSNIGRHSHARPSDKELWKKLQEAKVLIQQDRWVPASPLKLVADFDEIEETLKIDATLSEDHKKLLLQALDEITADDYAGTRPPQESYEPATKNLEMFAFSWQSGFFAERMYFKFSLAGADKGRRVFIYSIHPSREN